PLADELRQHFRRILQVRGHGDDRVATRLEERVIARANMTEIPVIDDHLDALVVARNALQYLDGAISGGVVDEYQLECVFNEIGGECLADSFVEIGDVVLFIEGTGDYAYQLHVGVQSVIRRWQGPSTGISAPVTQLLLPVSRNSTASHVHGGDMIR